jgi:hypothetical protein
MLRFDGRFILGNWMFRKQGPKTPTRRIRKTLPGVNGYSALALVNRPE